MPSGIYQHKLNQGFQKKHLVSSELRNKVRLSLIGKQGRHTGHRHSKKAREKIRLSLLGKKHPHTTLQNIRIGNANRGKKHTEEFKQAIRERMVGKTGEMAKNWQGGVSFQPYPEDWTDYLRESIRKRDNYTCQLCGIHQDELGGFYKKLDIHHIDYNKDNLNPENLTTLCRGCHMKTNNKRDYWIKFFKYKK